MAVGEPADSSTLRALEEASRAHPAQTVAKLGALLQTLPPDAPQRMLALALRGMLQARRHDADGVATSLQALDALKVGQPLAATARALVRATQARVNGPRHRADRLAQDGLAALPADGHLLLRWWLTSLLADIQEDGGDFAAALRLRHHSLALADSLGELWRRCDSRGALAYTLLLAGQAERGRAVNDESLAMARAAGNDLAISRALNVQIFFLAASGDAAGELQALEGAIRHARQAGSGEDAVLGLANLADHYLQRGDHDTALKLSREALPLARELADQRSESVALGNIGLALISKRQLDEGLRHTRASLALDERLGALTSMASFERETGSYLERAGYLREAVAAYRRHRKLADEVSRRDQQQAVLALQEAHDHQHRQRGLALLERDQDLQQAQLLNQALTQRLWIAGTVAALLLVAVAGLLLHRLRRHNSALKEGNALLRTLGEHDALTGLANRHRLHRLQLGAKGGTAAPFEGGLLLIDIDHFKRINDRHGHAAGDSVLVETARRLRAVLRAPDLIVRWGGEEFLVVTPALPQAQLEGLAQRLLSAVGERPVALGTTGMASVAVTASIGFASFPTAPTGLAVPWERAMALVDTALYLAKAHGRNLAYGIRSLQARDDRGLAAVSHDLEAAWRAGQVQLAVLRGPGDASPRGGATVAGVAGAAVETDVAGPSRPPARLIR